jgi:hypothetical protein
MHFIARYVIYLCFKRQAYKVDGGGIRGYSSLIIMRQIMKEVKRIERHGLPSNKLEQHSSYAPESYVPCLNARRALYKSDGNTDGCSCGEFCRYLPCHYFDYIGGTSTGGYVLVTNMCYHGRLLLNYSADSQA